MCVCSKSLCVTVSVPLLPSSVCYRRLYLFDYTLDFASVSYAYLSHMLIT